MATRFKIKNPIDVNLVSRETAAVALNCSLPTVQKLIDRNQLTGYRLPMGRLVLVDRREVESLAIERQSSTEQEN
ncbi:excisionase family DNA-binding protein [Rhodococcoides yunnanense]|uniref:excisionase family DNA-binding protein n=1 Tax=Rhodococcoides yunnanense TaxID=278209 RepID=UPI0009324949|nr:excisionase family DNA-binding protein [Rhodococcus yunnanensis]